MVPSKVLKMSLFTASWRQPLHEGCIPNVRERRGKERPGTTADPGTNCDGPSLTQHQIECILAFACCHEYSLNMSKQLSLHLSNSLLRDRGFFGKPVRGLLSRLVSSHYAHTSVVDAEPQPRSLTHRLATTFHSPSGHSVVRTGGPSR